MTKTNHNISLPQKCIVMRNGIQIWTDARKAEQFERDWRAGLKAAVGFEGRTLNTVDIIGVFMPEDMDDMTRRKNGQWLCQHGTWHDRGEKCACRPKEERELAERRAKAIKECGKCMNGWVQGENGMKPCECVKSIKK